MLAHRSVRTGESLLQGSARRGAAVRRRELTGHPGCAACAYRALERGRSVVAAPSDCNQNRKVLSGKDPPLKGGVSLPSRRPRSLSDLLIAEHVGPVCPRFLNLPTLDH